MFQKDITYYIYVCRLSRKKHPGNSLFLLIFVLPLPLVKTN